MLLKTEFIFAWTQCIFKSQGKLRPEILYIQPAGSRAYLFVRQQRDPVDTAVYSSGAVIKTYTSLEPRLSLNYLLDETSSNQNLLYKDHAISSSLSSSTETNPSDLWIPAAIMYRPQYADQVDLGYLEIWWQRFWNITSNYYKNMQNVIDYKNGADLQRNPNIESLLLTAGDGVTGRNFL